MCPLAALDMRTSEVAFVGPVFSCPSKPTTSVRNLSTLNVQEQRKRRFRMPVFSYVKYAKRTVANVQITASIKQEQRKRSKT